ncbi:hypothetical protein [Bordetella ansorpii]|uniref:hypothetical protein n=1 Tax=Bordetella ansorpii TaxID=288768 RepID=UPI0012E95BA5|nr:hypothetical protein [Bordetella ansorpii]
MALPGGPRRQPSGATLAVQPRPARGKANPYGFARSAAPGKGQIGCTENPSPRSFDWITRPKIHISFLFPTTLLKHKCVCFSRNYRYDIKRAADAEALPLPAL